MSTHIACPDCGQKLNVQHDMRGKRVKCPGCGASFIAADEEAPEGADPAVSATPEVAKAARRGREPLDDDEDEGRERRRRRPRPDDEEDDQGDVVSTLIPYKNPKALAAYYCGVFSLIPCIGLILGPIALIMGILGMRAVRAHPSMKGTGHAIAGIVLGSITFLGHLVIIILVVIAALSPRR